MEIKYLSETQKVEVETLLCYGFEVCDQLKSGTIILTDFSKMEDGLHVKNELHIFNDGSSVKYE